jgi:hypothetical protein
MIALSDSSTTWALAFGLSLVFAVLRLLVTIGKWRGARPWFTRGGTTANAVGLALTVLLSVFLCVGLVRSI